MKASSWSPSATMARGNGRRLMLRTGWWLPRKISHPPGLSCMEAALPTPPPQGSSRPISFRVYAKPRWHHQAFQDTWSRSGLRAAVWTRLSRGRASCHQRRHAPALPRFHPTTRDDAPGSMMPFLHAPAFVCAFSPLQLSPAPFFFGKGQTPPTLFRRHTSPPQHLAAAKSRRRFLRRNHRRQTPRLPKKMRAFAALLALCAAAVPALVAAVPMGQCSSRLFPNQPSRSYPVSFFPVPTLPDDASSVSDVWEGADPFRSYTDFVLWSLDAHIEVTQMVINAVSSVFLEAKNTLCDFSPGGVALFERLIEFYDKANEVLPGDNLPCLTSIDNEEVSSGLDRLATALVERLRDFFKQTKDNIGSLRQSSFDLAVTDMQSSLQELGFTDPTAANPLPLLKLWAPVLRHLDTAMVLNVHHLTYFKNHGVLLAELLEHGEQFQAAFAGDALRRYLASWGAVNELGAYVSACPHGPAGREAPTSQH
ncbi:MAG: hypothetical protein BJ554DRAFT_7227, partial [Olpidium bornovanus]